MTTTLGKVSTLANLNLSLLTGEERKSTIDDLEHLLVGDVPSTEIKPETRTAFATTLLSRMSSRIQEPAAQIAQISRTLAKRREDSENGKPDDRQAILKQVKELESELRDMVAGRRREGSTAQS